MRVLWVSNAPWVATGYGQQTAQVVERMKADGHDVAVACNYGFAGNTTKWRGVTVLPQGYDQYSNDIIPSHAATWLEGEPGDGWVMPLFDVWAFRNPRYQRFNLAPWVPVDHRPAPPPVVEWLREMFAVPIAMSRFGEAMLANAGLEPLYVPHAVDTAVFCPGDKAAAREAVGVPEDAFVVTMNAANKGREIDRKSFFESFAGFAALRQRHSDAVLFLHTEKLGLGGGVNLVTLAQQVGIPEDAIYFVDQYAYRLGHPQSWLAELYQASDVLLAPSRGEGFGIPVIEAQSCGTPCIVSNFTSQPELVADGWLVDGEPYMDYAQSSYLWKPAVAAVIDCLSEAYDARTAVPSAKAREHALAYDCDRVWAEHWRPALKQLEARLPTLEPIKATAA